MSDNNTGQTSRKIHRRKKNISATFVCKLRRRDEGRVDWKEDPNFKLQINNKVMVGATSRDGLSGYRRARVDDDCRAEHVAKHGFCD